MIKHHHAVLLLDEIEKAHFDMYNILLQIMDYGRLTDNNGRKADFRHVIIIMTTNAGADMMERNTYGFADQINTDESLVAIKRRFTPEFRNRLDAILQFGYLDPYVVGQIVDKNFNELQAQLKPHGIKATMTQGARKWLVENGYDKNMGARPMERLFNERIRKPLSEEILFSSNSEERTVSIGASQNKLTIKVKSSAVKSLVKQEGS